MLVHCSSQMDYSVYVTLQSVMLGLDDETLFKPFSRKRFVKAQDSDYDVIRDAMDNNQLFFTGSPSNMTVELKE